MRHLRTLSVAGLFHIKDFSAYLTDPPVIRATREAAQQCRRMRATIVFTGDPIALPPELAGEAVQLRLGLPGPDELRAELTSVLTSLRRSHRVAVAIEPDDLDRIVNALSGFTVNQARQALAFVMLEDGRLGPDDVATLFERKAQLIEESGLLEYFPADDTGHQLGGFGRLKSWLKRARLGFTAQAAAMNLTPPRGVLIVGIQGCGKSLAAKVIAREWGMPLLKLDAGRLFDKYIGETEKNFRRAVSLAVAMAPAVLWIDEIEKAFGGSGGDGDGGVSQRLLASLLTWLQERGEQVFVVATANDLFKLPPELLRKGRFDEIFYVDLPDEGERAAIFGIHLGRRNLSLEGFDVPRLSAAAEGFSGAEIEQAVISAAFRALHDGGDLGTDHLLVEIAETVPLSVSRREDVERLRSTAAGRFVPVR
jgi:SpoVK/Ycf46/Vps4 family AAA+-type ATPase